MTVTDWLVVAILSVIIVVSVALAVVFAVDVWRHS